MSTSGPLTVRYLPDFFYGKMRPAPDNPNYTFVDYPFLEDEEKDLLDRWIFCISSQEESGHKGNNKNSWTVNSPTGKYDAKSAASYKRFLMFHYHAVDPDVNFPAENIKTAWFLPENDRALGCASVVHYSKKKIGEILVVAFARIHNPFPTISDTTNPLRNRIHKY